VPSGAGHVARVADHLHEVFQAAWGVVDNCECDEDTSCYSYLRNYGNQFVHDELNRGAAVKILSSIV